jgi:uncharacterized protein YegL
MLGPPLHMLQQCLKELMSGLRNDPQAIENAYISVITFASEARQVCPLTELMMFQQPEIQVGGSSCLGAALSLLEQCINREVQRPSPTQKGDWKPFAFIFTTEQPADDWMASADRLKQSNSINIVVCAVDSNADSRLLKRISDIIYKVDSLDRNALMAHFKWVSCSVKTPSQSLSSIPSTNWVDLPPAASQIPMHQDDRNGAVAIDGDSSLINVPNSAADKRGLNPAASEEQLSVDDFDTPILNEQLGSNYFGGNSGSSEELGMDSSVVGSTPRGNYSSWVPAESQEAVDCTVFAPPEIELGDSIMVQVFAHLPEHEERARTKAIEFDTDAQRRGTTSLGTVITKGARLTFELLLGGLTVEASTQGLTWRGQPDSVQFAVSAPANTPLRTIIGKLLVSQDSVPIGQISFKLKVVTFAAIAAKTTMPCGVAHRYVKAFISYASSDRAEVLRRVQMLTAAGIEFFQDLINLEPGDRWSNELFHHIEDSDVLFLFWSSAARNSEWVEKEWRYGLQKKGEEFIRPVIIEGPPIVPPPPELAHLHFNDKILYMIGLP